MKKKETLKDIVNSGRKISLTRKYPKNGVLKSKTVYIVLDGGLLRISSTILENNTIHVGIDLKKYFWTTEGYNEEEFMSYAVKVLSIVTSYSDGREKEMDFLKSIGLGLVSYAIHCIAEQYNL